MFRNVIIIGNSGAALECHTLLTGMLVTPVVRTIYTFKGFLSHKGYKGNLGVLSHCELGSDADYIPQERDVFALGIGNNALRLEAYQQMKAKGGEFINLISPWVEMAPTVQMGEGNNIHTGCRFSENVVIGNANYLNGNACLGHGVNMGDGNFLGQQSMIMGSAQVGNCNHLSPGAMIMEHAQVGNHNKISPLSVLFKGCKDNCLMAGNPAIKLTTT